MLKSNQQQQLAILQIHTYIYAVQKSFGKSRKIIGKMRSQTGTHSFAAL